VISKFWWFVKAARESLLIVASGRQYLGKERSQYIVPKGNNMASDRYSCSCSDIAGVSAYCLLEWIDDLYSSIRLIRYLCPARDGERDVQGKYVYNVDKGSWIWSTFIYLSRDLAKVLHSLHARLRHLL